MNFNDVLENALELEKISKNLYEIGEKFEECLKFKAQWECDCTKILIFHSIVGGYEPQITYARSLENSLEAFYKSFKEKLRNINCMDFWMSLYNINNKFDSIINTEKLKEDIRENYGIIHKYMNGTLVEEDFEKEYTNAINSINVIIGYKNLIKEKIDTIKRINVNLNEGVSNIPFRIRLLNQENRLDSTIISLETIKAMYSTICILMNISEEENPIKYSRVESGSFLMNLLGDPVVLGIVGSIIGFSYKVYNDHFSTKAKQEKVLGNIKIRGELIKLIKESGEDIIKDEEIIKNSLAKLEVSSLELYNNSSCIELNGEKYGQENINRNLVSKYIEEVKKIAGPIKESGVDDL